MSTENWTCPHCERHVTIVDGKRSVGLHFLDIENADAPAALRSSFRVCPNPECERLTLDVDISTWESFHDDAGMKRRRLVIPTDASWRLVPWGKARSFPTFVPQAIRNDYQEAHAILQLSPKAAATLARRAVQGIIRDYFKITDKTLFAEIQKLEERIGNGLDQETWNSIDAVRSVGNIGAHMEQDVNVLIDVEPDEAEMLIGLVESLIEDTYIARKQREERHAKIKKLKEDKASAKDAAKAKPS